MQKKVIISLAFLCIALILVAGCSSLSNEDKAAGDKMSKMMDDMKPLMKSLATAAGSEDFTTMGATAMKERTYIDANLPEMRSLTDKATTKKAVFLEYIAFLEDERKSDDSLVKAVAARNSGAGGYYTYMTVATDYKEKATAHLNACMALM
jgi:hypothetical protein